MFTYFIYVYVRLSHILKRYVTIMSSLLRHCHFSNNQQPFMWLNDECLQCRFSGICMYKKPKNSCRHITGRAQHHTTVLPVEYDGRNNCSHNDARPL